MSNIGCPDRCLASPVAELGSSPDGLHRADRNLYVKVAGGSRIWMFVWRENYVQRKKSLGPVDLLDLDDAKAEAIRLRKALRAGEEINGGRAGRRGATAGAPTFADVAKDVIRAKTPTWRDPRGASIWASSLERFVFPAIGGLRPRRSRPSTSSRSCSRSGPRSTRRRPACASASRSCWTPRRSAGSGTAKTRPG